MREPGFIESSGTKTSRASHHGPCQVYLDSALFARERSFLWSCLSSSQPPTPALESSTSTIFKGIRHVGYVCSFAFFSFQCSPDKAIVLQVRVHTVRANILDAPGHPPTSACLVSTDANFRLHPNIKRCTRNNFLGRAGGVLHSSEPWICASTCIHLHMAVIIWIAGSLNKREFFLARLFIR
jgi:hypothetical protein